MNYGTAVGLILLSVIILVFGLVSVMHKDDDIVHGAIKYGHPSEMVDDRDESMFQVIMVTKARLEDKIDHNVIYGVLEEKFIYIRDAANEIMDNLVYGKFYECNVFKNKLGEIDYIELKGV